MMAFCDELGTLRKVQKFRKVDGKSVTKKSLEASPPFPPYMS
jgi:hypothetical protein